jgi:hypothetical protein
VDPYHHHLYFDCLFCISYHLCTAAHYGEEYEARIKQKIRNAEWSKARKEREKKEKEKQRQAQLQAKRQLAIQLSQTIDAGS